MSSETPVCEHWYEIVSSGGIRQGDIFRDLLVGWLPQDLQIGTEGSGQDPAPTAAEFLRASWIVMSASCDIERGPENYPHILLGRVVPATKKEFRMGEAKFKLVLELARRGEDPSKFLLPAHPGINPGFPMSFVQARMHITLPHSYLARNCSTDRLRLRHPFRESFGNWIGNIISRVGPETPTLMPRFVDKVQPADKLAALELDHLVSSPTIRQKPIPWWKRLIGIQ